MVGDSKFGDLGIYANATHPSFPAGAKKNARFWLESKRKVCDSDNAASSSGVSSSGGNSISSSRSSSSSSSSSESSSSSSSSSEADGENRPQSNKRPRPPSALLYMPGNRAEFPLHASR
jgi:hypothetical protein